MMMASVYTGTAVLMFFSVDDDQLYLFLENVGNYVRRVSIYRYTYILSKAGFL